MYRIFFVSLALFLLTSTIFAQKLPPQPTAEQYAEMEESWSTLLPDAEECVGTNLIANPSFEGEYSSYVPNPAHPDCPWGTCGSAQMANSWTPYWKSQNPDDEEWIYRMPEWKPAESHFTNPVRVRTGERAQQWFTFFGTHQAGIFQRISNVSPGDALCLSIWGHSWSNNSDDAYTDPNDHGFLNQQIGIDPTGGTDYLSSNVIWTNPVTQYDEYGLFKLEATAQSESVTVFFHSEPLWAYKHNDVYWDDAILTITDGGEPASMSASPTWIALEAEQNQPATQTAEVDVTIENASSMGWDATVLTGSTLAPTLRQAEEQLYLDVDTTGMAAGSYRANVEISADDPTIEGGRQYITVDLKINPSDPIVVASPDRFIFMTDSADAVTAATQIDILSGETLTWTATISESTRIQEFTIAFKSDTGSSGDALEFTAFSAGLPTGTYTTTMLVDTSVTATRAEIPVTFIVVEKRHDVWLPSIRR